MSEIIPLDPEQLIAAARNATGLHDFDELALDEPLARLTTALNAEAGLNAAGRRTWHDRLLNILMTRLRAQDWFRRHPEILQERLAPAIVILGLPRTGTTLLKRGIASVARIQSVAWWENRFPVPLPEDPGDRRRRAAGVAEVKGILEAMPLLASIHPWDALAADEDILLLDQTLFSTTSETMAHLPSYHRWLKQQDLRPAYRYWKKLLQFLQWQQRRRGHHGERWVLKTPMHLGYVEVIDELLPEALFVQTHRDPLVTIPSYASMIHFQGLLGSDHSDPLAAGKLAADTLSAHLGRCMLVRDTLPAEKFIDVDFREITLDPIALIERIYEHIGLPMTSVARRTIEAYRDTNPREGRPPHAYTLEQFGFSEQGLQSLFLDYRQRYL
jgi:hypothetical protein